MSNSTNEENALKALYNGIMNDSSIQRFTLQWKDVIKMILNKCGTVKRDSNIQFQNSLLQNAAKCVSDDNIKNILSTFAKELQINIETYNSIKNSAKS